MQAVTALYKEGTIQSEQTGVATDSSEQDFQAIGQANFFETDEDNNTDWEDIFDVKPR